MRFCSFIMTFITKTWRPEFNYSDCPRLSGKEVECMQKPFEEEKVLATIKLCVADKAPRPDGYSIRLLYKCW